MNTKIEKISNLAANTGNFLFLYHRTCHAELAALNFKRRCIQNSSRCNFCTRHAFLSSIRSLVKPSVEKFYAFF